jgi:hypothetical protein
MKTFEKKLASIKKYQEKNKDIIKEKKKAYYLKNKEKIKENAAIWQKENHERVIELKTEWRELNKESVNKYLRNWKQQNKDKVYSWTACRRGSLLNATPKWITKNNIKEISEFYLCAEMFSMYTGNKYHVDHIIPLRGKMVNGLHIPENLQVIPAKENLRKHNSFTDSITN